MLEAYDFIFVYLNLNIKFKYGCYSQKFLLQDSVVQILNYED